MDVRFQPYVTERRFRKLAYGKPGSSGLVGTWVGLDIRDDYGEQLELASQARRLLGLDILLQVLHTTFGPVFIGVITRKMLEFICWRIAANLDALLVDRPIKPWRGLERPIVAPLQVVSTRFGWSLGNVPRPGRILTFQVIDGEVCPIRFRRWFPTKFLYVLARDIGIGGWRASKPFDGHHAQFFGMRFVAYIANSKFESGDITIERHHVGQFAEHNRKLMRRRAKACPRGYKEECHQCALGEDACPDREPVSRACRPATLEGINCSICGERTWHDRGDCTKCHHRKPIVRVSLGERDG